MCQDQHCSDQYRLEPKANDVYLLIQNLQSATLGAKKAEKAQYPSLSTFLLVWTTERTAWNCNSLFNTTCSVGRIENSTKWGAVHPAIVQITWATV